MQLRRYAAGKAGSCFARQAVGMLGHPCRLSFSPLVRPLYFGAICLLEEAAYPAVPQLRRDVWARGSLGMCL